MKVNIGPYIGDFISISRLENYYFQKKYDVNPSLVDEIFYDRYDRFFVKFIDWLSVVVTPINRWIYERRDRKIEVNVDRYDIWSADVTLAHVIYPVLVELRKNQQGYPLSSESDLPEEVLSLSPEEQWNWILDEMIWAFDQIRSDDADAEFYHNEDQLDMKFVDDNGTSSLQIEHQKDPSKPKYWVDKEGLSLYNDRISRGTALFGKYFRSLWD